jgi:hypothetical protein
MGINTITVTCDSHWSLVPLGTAGDLGEAVKSVGKRKNWSGGGVSLGVDSRWRVALYSPSVLREGAGHTAAGQQEPLPDPGGLAHPPWQGCQPGYLTPRCPWREKRMGGSQERKGKVGEKR